MSKYFRIFAVAFNGLSMFMAAVCCYLAEVWLVMMTAASYLYEQGR